MELDELKSAWNKYNQSEETKRNISANEVDQMLTVQTRDITYKIGKNIRIGVGIVLAWVVLGIASNFVITPLFNKILDKPYMTDSLLDWSLFTDVCSYVLILITILIFWFRYTNIEKRTITDANLNDTLTRLIAIVKSYKKMFYIVLCILLFYITVAFSSGFFLETTYQLHENGKELNGLSFSNWLVIILGFSLSLGIFLGVYILLFNIFFKRLYGRYLNKMESTLKELNEVNS